MARGSPASYTAFRRKFHKRIVKDNAVIFHSPIAEEKPYFSHLMAFNGSPANLGDVQNNLEKIKRHLASGSGKNLLQGPLLKRSENLRKWNKRWVILDPTTGKMEYKMSRNEPVIKGTMPFDSTSTIVLSPVNLQDNPKYDGCCFYIGTPPKKQFFLCAETPGAARAWVSTLHASQLVLRAHKEAVNSLGSAQMGTVAKVVTAANSAALEATKEIEAAMRVSMRASLATITNKSNDHEMDYLETLKETLREKDDELGRLSKDLRARDSAIKEIVDKLADTAEAAEAAASAARVMDEERRLARVEIDQLTDDTLKQLGALMNKLRESNEKVAAINKEKELLLKQRDSGLHEAEHWRIQLGKAQEHAVTLEAAALRADERARLSQADAEAKLKYSGERELAAAREKEELLSYVNILQSQIQRQETNTKQVINEISESCSDADRTLSFTKHVDISDENVDKSCLRRSGTAPHSAVRMALDGADIRPISDVGWGSFQSVDARTADVREISHEEGRNLDIPVVRTADIHHQEGSKNFQP